MTASSELLASGSIDSSASSPRGLRHLPHLARELRGSAEWSMKTAV